MSRWSCGIRSTRNQLKKWTNGSKRHYLHSQWPTHALTRLSIPLICWKVPGRSSTQRSARSLDEIEWPTKSIINQSDHCSDDFCRLNILWYEIYQILFIKCSKCLFLIIQTNYNIIYNYFISSYTMFIIDAHNECSNRWSSYFSFLSTNRVCIGSIVIFTESRNK